VFECSISYCKLTAEMDIFNFGKIIENLEANNWGNVDEVYLKPGGYYGNIAGLVQSSSSSMAGHQSKSSYSEDLITPQLLQVQDLVE